MLRGVGRAVAGGCSRARDRASPQSRARRSNNPSADRIADPTRAVQAGTIRPVIDTVFPVHDIAAVHRRLESGGVRGKYVIGVRLS
ncbi:zinc-binding dehydrogenase [Streptomyces sp. NPDC018026]|uniref:zinc-binding dehydrogenase n=1 Tax=Streptomyces sp. NPDC018026 TaxID=3365031 RepID=UPI0037B5F9EF